MTVTIDKTTGEDEKHEGDVTSFVFHDGLLYSSGGDGKIKIWDENLNLKQTIAAHVAYIFAMAIDSKGRLYSSCCDGTIKLIENPKESPKGIEIVRCDDTIESLSTFEEILYSGDDKGVVTKWMDDKIKFKYNLVEEVRSLLVYDDLLYTVCDKDVVVTSIDPSAQSGRYLTRATLPGNSPLAFVGPKENNFGRYLIFPTRDGKGINAVWNSISYKFGTLWVKHNVHEMIINALCGTDDAIYSGGWDGKLKKLTNIDSSAEVVDEIDVGNCINVLNCSFNSSSVFIGCSNGNILKVSFT